MSATGANSPKLTYDQFKARKQRRVLPYPIVTDDDAVITYQQAKAELAEGRKSQVGATRIRQLEAAVARAEQDLRDATIVVRLRAMLSHEYAALRAEHPPTAEDDAQIAESTNGAMTKAQFHADTFGPALVAACLVEPQVTIEQATEMAAEMNSAEWAGLFSAAISVNQQATPTAGLVFS